MREGWREGGRESPTLTPRAGLSHTGLSEGLLTFLRFRAHTIQWLRWNNTSLLRLAVNDTLLITALGFVHSIPGDPLPCLHKSFARCDLFILNELTSLE